MKITNRTLLIALGIFTSAPAIGQSSQKNDLQQINLRDKVKSLHAATYKASGNPASVEKGKRTFEFVTENGNSDFLFSSDGKIMEKTEFVMAGEFRSTKNIFKYNEKGIVIESQAFTGDSLLRKEICQCTYKSLVTEIVCRDLQGNISGNSRNKFDNKGNLVEEISMMADGKIWNKVLSKFDKNGNKIEEISYNSENPEDARDKWTAAYDSRGNMISSTYYIAEAPPDFSFQDKLDYKYDSLGRLIELVRYEMDFETMQPKPADKISYKYDVHGNKIEEKDFTTEAETSYVHTYQYEYDPRGNWVKLIRSDNGIPTHIIEREITYYAD